MLLVTVLLLVFFTKLYMDFEVCVCVNYCMFLKLFPGCCTEVVCCFCSGDWICLSLPSLLVYHGHPCLMVISFTCITQSKFTVACIKYSVFKREKMPSSHELPQHNKLDTLKRSLLEKSVLEI